ncbi:2'-5' RNA ligase family protein [Antrihabitans cavernicola]|uniref:2'-5' RNA ligase family protein n=1 Tax=Antrihabitans cavernicola TaxID=2495913 RepID=A0A5A7SA35_9NOCA|nr:2'-5' RNA ligase family protein [Spelaeibacter cavernicola]KAA0021071.1 2'-5' RNA ligase family protein [Spelaeibacter cavernicola]
MVQSVELLLDDGADSAVRRQWQVLADAGLPSQSKHTGPSNRPHVTLAVHDRITPETDAALERDLHFYGIAIQLGGLVVFGGRNATLARLVVPTEELLDVHEHIRDLLGPGRMHTDVGHWTPHVTLARRLHPDQVGSAIGLLLGEDDIHGRSVALRRWDGDNRIERLVAWEEST